MRPEESSSDSDEGPTSSPGLALMFFGFGLSALIGRPFVGTLIAGLPKLRLLGLGSMSNPLTAYDIPGLSRGPHRRPDLVAAVPHHLGTWVARGRRKPGGSRRGRVQPRPAAISGPGGCRTARRNCWSAPLPVADADANLGRRHDCRPRFHRDCAGTRRGHRLLVDKAKEAAAANALIDQGADASVKIGCGRGLFEKAALHLA